MAKDELRLVDGKDILVRLTSSELIQAAMIGTMRRIQDIKKGRRPQYGIGHDREWQADMMGAIGELVVAKTLNRFWNGALGDLGAADVDHSFEVRTRSEHWHDLLLHDKDKDDLPYILVTGYNDVYVIRGWIYGLIGKSEQFWADKSEKNRWAFFVPQEILDPLSELPKTLLRTDAQDQVMQNTGGLPPITF